MKAVLLAAGKSERLGGFRSGLPKVLLPVAGKTILERNLAYLKAAGIREVLINLHYKPELIRGLIRRKGTGGLKVTFSEEAELRGTAGAVKLIERRLRGSDFLVLYGDNLVDFDVRRVMEAHRKSKAWVTIAVYNPRRTAWSGIAAGMIRTDRRGRIVRFEEKRSNEKIGPGSWVNAGLLAVSPRVLKMIPAGRPYDFSRDLYPALLRLKRRIQVVSGASYVLASDTIPAWKETCRIAKEAL
ncbi:MAG: nucleotidyltransferase family protein [Candidatus Omnitrophica bacterium]|nr:nucleotidyltransferase family protein [Candidatus Omnitrophota bacterium]